MPASDDATYDEYDVTEVTETYAAHEERGEATRDQTGMPPVAATGDFEGALRALEKAEDDYDAAQDALADLEGRIVVLDFKATAVEAAEDAEDWQRAAAQEDLAKAKRAFNRAGTRLQRAERALERAGDQVEAEKEALRNAVVVVEEEEPPPQPRFATVDLFVEQFVLPNWVHRYVAKNVRWCDRWFEHAEAITRFEAMWEAFEVMRQQPAPSYSTWLRDHFDVHMRTLTDPDGVFHECDVKEGVHKAGPAWKVQIPEGMFATIETAQIQRAVAEAAATPQAAETHPSGPVEDQTRATRNTITQHSNTTSGVRR